MKRNSLRQILLEKKWFIGAALLIGFVGALFVFYTSSSAAQFTISTSVNNSINGVDGTNPATAFISDQVGYAFSRDNGGTCSYTKTTNGGTSWGSLVQVSGGCQHITIWYDRWTPGDTGNYIHIAITDTGIDTIYYNRLDTSTDTLSNGSSGVAIETTVTNTMALTGNFPAISKSTTGVLYAGVNDAGTAGDTGWVFKCSSSCNTTGGWSDTSIALINTSDRDAISLAPLPGGDMIAVVRDFTASDILSKVYDEGTTTWDGTWATVDAAAAVRSDLTANSLATVVNINTNDLYIVYTADNNSLGTNDDIRTAHYSSGTWTLKTDIVTNTAKGVLGAAIGIDLNTDDIYIGYMLRTTPATVATANVYWQKSTDGMTTWGGEQGPLNTAESSFFNVRINGVSDERMMVSWNEPGTTSLFGYMVADMTPNPEFEQESYRWFANQNSTATSTVPTIVDSTMGKYNIGSGGTTISMPAGVLDGDQLILFVSTYTGDPVYTPGGTGWTNFFPTTTAGTQVDVGWAKTYTTGMTVTLSSVTSRMTIVSLTAIRGAKAPSQWIAGSIWDRPTYGTSTTTVAPGVTTTETNNLVLSFFGERTLVDETDIVSMTNATKHLYGYDTAVVQDETITIGYIAQESIGTTSNVTVTYENSQASNGLGQQVAIPPVTVAAEADIGSSLAAQDTAYTSMPTGTPFRLRLNLGLVSGSLSASSYNLKLQYKLQTSGVCTTSGSYADVTTATPVKFHNNTNITDGIDYVTSLDDPVRSGQTTIKQHYVESNPFTNVEATILDDDNIWDIALVADTATIGEKYCFKAMKSDGTLFTTYTHIPEITFIAPTPSLTQQLRGGQSVIDGVKIPFSL